MTGTPKAGAWIPTAPVTVGAMLISFSPVFVRVAHVGPATTAFYRLFLGGLVLAAFAAAKVRPLRLDGASLLLAGLCGVVIALDLTIWHLSIRLIGPGLATILGNHQVFVVSAFGILFLGERLSLRIGLSIALAVTGLFLIFGLDWGEFDAPFRIGVLCGMLTAMLYAIFLLVLRYVQSRPTAPDPVVTVAALSIIGSAVLAVYVWAAAESFAVPDATTWVVLFAYAVVCHVIGWVLISTGLPGLPVSRAGLLLLLQPALAFLWDVLLFDRPTTAIEVLGASLALCAIYFGAVKSGR